ncbi:YfcC family protein [Salinicoccus hispanicus]|uniref:C4-dicarboxylate ABC transporter permease n=1 Tax=Salinicoccus hispanicus TaxID=157225 RepID=A0A6N8TWQ4_9STAP|nr:Na+/H+ antiporter NhaC family protein [Salinicoccus hispanicus]MXQ50368.1 C4-dicarboxylate ABC transporter permease [Salinicoccus hispanicus]
MKYIKIPHAFVLIYAIVILAMLMSYIIPAGEYERYENENGTLVVDETSFQYTEQTPVHWTEIFRSVPEGMTDAAGIIFLIFIIGGAFGMINGTGAIEAGINKVVSLLKNREVILIPLTMLIFSFGGATFGMAESTLIFIPMGIMLARSLGMDAMTGMAMVALGAAAGFSGGFMNIFTVGVAQQIAELPLFSGMFYRIIIQLVFVLIAAFFVYRYGRRVQKDMNNSYVYGLEKNAQNETYEFKELTSRHILVLLIIFSGFGLIIYGVVQGWSTGTDLSAIFLAMGIVSGLVGGNTPNGIAEDFIKGAKEVTFGALIVGLARCILLILEDGTIIDTIIFSISTILEGLPASVAAVGMFLTQFMINFFIPSGSGQAATTIPLLAPIGDIVGVSRQSVVLAFQMGDGLANYLFPTSAILMAGLSIANIPYEKWLRFVWPVMLVWVVAGATFMVVSLWIGYGPF